MFDRRAENVRIFQDTERMISENDILKTAVKKSIDKQRIYLQGEEYDFGIGVRRDTPAAITVSKKRSFEAASSYARTGKKVCVLNFASATNPGGGVTHGSSAQEECLCRCSTLYNCLNVNELWGMFYTPHRVNHSALYNDDCIYTPDVCVIKTDTSMPERMKESDWYKVDVLTCAAPNLRSKPSNRCNPEGGEVPTDLTYEKLRSLLASRINRVFQVAMSKGADVLVLGAFGCGAFRNPPKLVAEIFKELTEKYRNYFDVIEYAVYCRGYETENYDAFCEAFQV